MAKKVEEKVKVSGITSKVLTCKCKNEYQDRRYGVGKRVMNALGGGKGGKAGEYRCTVCGSVSKT